MRIVIAQIWVSCHLSGYEARSCHGMKGWYHVLSVQLAPPLDVLASDAAPFDISIAAFLDVHLLRKGDVCGYRAEV